MAFVANVKSAKYEKYYGCDFKMLKSNEDYLFGVCVFFLYAVTMQVVC